MFFVHSVVEILEVLIQTGKQKLTHSTATVFMGCYVQGSMSNEYPSAVSYTAECGIRKRGVKSDPDTTCVSQRLSIYGTTHIFLYIFFAG
jgi:hypothetical protein